MPTVSKQQPYSPLKSTSSATSGLSTELSSQPNVFQFPPHIASNTASHTTTSDATTCKATLGTTLSTTTTTTTAATRLSNPSVQNILGKRQRRYSGTQCSVVTTPHTNSNAVYIPAAYDPATLNTVAPTAAILLPDSPHKGLYLGVGYNMQCKVVCVYLYIWVEKFF